MSFKALKSQFDWLLDGELANLVTKNLQQELKNMELVLRYWGGFFAVKSSDTSINQLEMLRSWMHIDQRHFFSSKMLRKFKNIVKHWLVISEYERPPKVFKCWFKIV